MVNIKGQIVMGKVRFTNHFWSQKMYLVTTR